MRMVHIAFGAALAAFTATTAFAQRAESATAPSPLPPGNLSSVVTAPPGSSPRAQLWDNGPFISGIGNGAGGAHTSVVQSAWGYYGFNMSAEYHYRLADDFDIGFGKGWDITELHWTAYETGAPTSGTITRIQINLWEDKPVTGGVPTVYGPHNAFKSSNWTGAYRVTSTNLLSTSRAIIRVIADIPNIPPLGKGNWWFDVEMEGAIGLTGPWGNPKVPAALFGDNARQRDDNNVWTDVQGQNGRGQDFPFDLFGSANSGPWVYCKSRVTSCGTTPSINGPSGEASVSAGSGSFDVSCGIVCNSNGPGILIYSTDGPAMPAIANAYGHLCVGPGGVHRVMPPVSPTYLFFFWYRWDFGHYLATQVKDPDLKPGARVDMQSWYRDPGNPGGGNLSNAMFFYLVP